MTSVRELLGRIADRTASAEDVAPEIARICRETAAAQERELEGMSRMDIVFSRMAGSLPERDETDTFVEVEAAYIGGSITQEQFTVLHRAMTGAP
jgi:hypothetical protein